jgi:hypothetical protein
MYLNRLLAYCATASSSEKVRSRPALVSQVADGFGSDVGGSQPKRHCDTALCALLGRLGQSPSAAEAPYHHRAGQCLGATAKRPSGQCNGSDH